MVCVRTASVATPARVLRATRERTVLLVRHCPLLRSPTSSCHRLSPWNHTRLSRGAAYPTLTHVLGKTHSSGRAGWCVLPAKHYGIPRFQRLSQCPEPPFSGHAAKELKPNPLLGTPQSQPCHCHLCCLAACPAVVPGLKEQGCGARGASQAPSCLGGHTAHKTVPEVRRTPENKLFPVQVKSIK